MNRRTLTLVLAMSMTAFLPGPSGAAEDASLVKDMASVIALLGLPCGQVLGVVTKGDNDHLVTCQDGNRYRVALDAAGRVVAQKQ
jgi:hypothetical protein